MPASRLAQSLRRPHRAGARHAAQRGAATRSPVPRAASSGSASGSLLGGAGSSTQHPLASAVIARAYGPGRAGAARHLQFRRRSREGGGAARGRLPADADGLAARALGDRRRGASWSRWPSAALLPREPASRGGRDAARTGTAAGARAAGPASGCSSPSACSTTPRGRPSCSTCRSCCRRRARR